MVNCLLWTSVLWASRAWADRREGNVHVDLKVSGTGYRFSPRQELDDQTDWPEPECRGSYFSGTDMTVRESLWLMMHSEMMPADDAIQLLQYEAQRGADEAQGGIDEEHQGVDETYRRTDDVQPDVVESNLREREGSRLRNQLSQWLTTVAETCSSQALCLAIARKFANETENTCSTATLLMQAQMQLKEDHARRLLDRSHRSGLIQMKDEHFTATQLAVKLWGLHLVKPPALPLSCASGSVLVEAEQSATTALSKTLTSTALKSLAKILADLADSGGDMLHSVRQFLKNVEKLRGVHGNQRGATGFPDSLLPLLRLLQEQRAQATPQTLLRDAVLVDYYEPRVREIETRWLRASGGDCSPSEDEDRSSSSNGLASLQASLDELSARLHSLAADHATALPTDMGALPAYWTGRLERVRRRLQDRLSGREDSRPVVLIWTCSYGGGHWAATKALEGYLPDYTTIVSDPTRDREYYEGDTFGSLMRTFVQPDWDSTTFFNNYILRRQNYGIWAAVESLQEIKGWLRGDGTRFARPCHAPKCDYQDKKFMRRALLRAAPDLVATVYHMDLLPISELCDELGGLPVLHLSTDLDAKMREVFGQRPAYPNLRVGIPFDVDEAWPTVSPLTSNQTFLSGYTVRLAFFRPLPTDLERHRLREQRGISQDSLVALVMSGSEGQSVPWPSRLADSKTWDSRLHVIVVAARNHEFGSYLEDHYRPRSRAGLRVFLGGSNNNVTIEVAREFANRRSIRSTKDRYYLSEDEIANLMDIADVLITKAGGGTTAEAAYRGVPTIFDATKGMLRWEDFNAKVFEMHGRGTRMLQPEELEDRMREALSLGRNRSLVVDRLTGQMIDSRQRVRQEIQQLLNSDTTGYRAHALT